MSHAYTIQVLKVAVAKICQTIGWHSTHTTTIDLLIDVTQHFLREISRIMQRYCELYNRTEPNLNDLALAYRDIGINMQELMEYIQFVDPIALPFAVPRFPLPKESNLNFLKPGSREMVKRPLHIPWYMPPMFPELEEGESGNASESNGNEDEKALVRAEPEASNRGLQQGSPVVTTTSKTDGNLIVSTTLTGGEIGGTEDKLENGATATLVDEGPLLSEALVNEEVEIPMQTLELKEPSAAAPLDHIPTQTVTDDVLVVESGSNVKRPETHTDKQLLRNTSEEGIGSKNNLIATIPESRPTRSISSVIMTTSGFISPAREGKLPESRIPVIPEERPPKLLQPPAAIMAAPPIVPPGTPLVISTTGATAAVHAPPASMSSSTGPPLTSTVPLPTTNLPMVLDSSYPNAASSSLIGTSTATGASFFAQGPISSSSRSIKSGGAEKPNKKTKKKPIDRERKKGEKKSASMAASSMSKGEKQPGGDKINAAKLPFSSDIPAAVEPKEWPSSHPLADLPPSDLTGMMHTVSPFPPVLTAPDTTPTGVSATSAPSAEATVLSKVGKSTKTKTGKEKVLKKRKPPQPVTDSAHGANLAVESADSFGKTPTKQPKVKTSAKRLKLAKKQQAQQVGASEITLPVAGVTDTYGEPPDSAAQNQPPPLIDPWRLSSSSSDKFGQSSSTPSYGISKIYATKPKANSKQTGSEAPAEPTTQLSLLQMMHPSLEITASPAPDRPHKQPGSGRKSGSKVAKEAKAHSLPPPAPPPLAYEREVIVIDDDKSPPRTPSLLVSPGSAGTVGESKKQRKQAMGGRALGADGTFAMGTPSHDYGGFSGPTREFTPSPASVQLSFRDFSSPEVHANAIPKTPDIKLQSSSSSSASLVSETGRAGKAYTPSSSSGNLFSEMSSTPIGGLMLLKEEAHEAPAAAPPVGKKQKRAKQKLSKSADGLKPTKVQRDSREQVLTSGPEQTPPGGKNPFTLFSPGGPGLGPYGTTDPTAYGKYLNQSLQAVGGMPFGLFPLSSGPGLIPDNPLFPRLAPGPYSIGPGGFPMPTMPFGLHNQMKNLLRMPHPLNRNVLGGHHHHQNAFDDNLDPETKLAQTPLDLQKSTCNVAPLVPPSLFQAVTSTSGDESLNLSLKLGPLMGSSGSGSSKATSTISQVTSQTKKESLTVGAGSSNVSSSTVSSNQSTSLGPIVSSISVKPSSSKQAESRKEDQAVILPAASVLPGASPPQRPNMCVIDIDDSDGSQSTATTGGKSKDGRRKPGKEHKKDRKLKEGKIKKKKDKKDKSKSKEREREQQLKELTAGTASSSSVMTMGMIGAEEALMEQLRKERKEKKEKRKDKLKKEKRKERERMLLGTGDGAASSTTVGELTKSGAGTDSLMGVGGGEVSSTSVPKLTLKLGGSNATQSPRSDTPEHHTMAMVVAATAGEYKRDGSPELARISALVTRPPKLKLASGSGGGTSAGSKNKKDDSPGKGLSVGGAGTDQQLLQESFEAGETFAATGKYSAIGSTGVIGTLGDASEAAPSGTALGNVNAKVSNFGTGASTGAAAAMASSTSHRGGKAARNLSLGSAECSSSAGTKSSSTGDGGVSKKAPKDASSKGSKSSSSAHHHHHHHASSSTLTTPAHMTDVDGNTVWICPACGRVDDGTPMIGCDGCDAWYHWVCVGIQVPPDDSEDWYCRVCIGKKQDSHTDTEKQRKRKKKDKKTPKD